MDFGTNVHVDDSVYNNTREVRVGVQLSLPFNEFAECNQVIAMPTNSTASYEKAGKIFMAVQRDPSDYTKGITRDIVGVDSRGIIAAGNTLGRVWGGADWAGMETGADGMLVGREIGVENDGVDQPHLDTPTSKYGTLFVAGYEPANRPATCGVFFQHGTAGWHKGIAARTDAFVGHPDDAFIVLYFAGTNNPNFKVGADGALTYQGRAVQIRPVRAADGSVVDALVLA